jgi:hypothetical protein
VRPTRPARIRVYRDRQKSFCVFLRRATGAHVVDHSDNEFLKCTDPVDTDSIDSVAISPDAPFVLRIEGTLIVRPDGQLLFDFGPFGSFVKDHGYQFLVGGFWRPIKPAPEDSLEDYTDKVLITVEKEALSSERHPSNEALEWTWPFPSAAEFA